LNPRFWFECIKCFTDIFAAKGIEIHKTLEEPSSVVRLIYIRQKGNQKQNIEDGQTIKWLNENGLKEK
jgi:hypothetical protein